VTTLRGVIAPGSESPPATTLPVTTLPVTTLPVTTLPVTTLLALETAGSHCSAAVLRDAVVLAAECRKLRHGHAEALLPMVERVMAAAGLPPSRLAAVAVAVGPGGFTGIRVGLAAAHGIALALGVRLMGVSSFAAVAAGLLESGRFAGCDRLLVALDSRRADLYVQLFACDSAAPLAAPQAVLPARLADYLAGVGGGGRLLIAGDAADVAAAALGECCGVTLASDAVPDALGVAAAALSEGRAGIAGGPVRPLYLRPPDVTLPPRRPRTPA